MIKELLWKLLSNMKATKSKKYKVQAYTALVDIYTELNSHEEALRCLDSLKTSEQGTDKRPAFPQGRISHGIRPIRSSIRDIQ